jgi:hypothetical protein
MTEETQKQDPHSEKSLEKMTVKELREIALKIPHAQAVHDMKKEEIVAFIKEARGIRDEAPTRKKGKSVKLTLTKVELKNRIRELKGLKMQAWEAKDGKRAKILRRRISRLKKRSRSAAAA